MSRSWKKDPEIKAFRKSRADEKRKSRAFDKDLTRRLKDAPKRIDKALDDLYKDFFK